MPAGAGAGVGSDLFLTSGTTNTFAPGLGNTITFNGTIADNSVTSLPTGQSYTAGSGIGANVTIGSTAQPGGTVIFNGTDTYAGSTTITSGALQAIDGVGLNTMSNLIINGGVFQSNGTFNRALGTGSDQVQFTADGGFAAAGGALTANIGGASAPLTFGQTNFLANGQSLVFGSPTATNTVTFQNSLNLNGQNQTILATPVTGNVAAGNITGILSNGSLTVGDSTHGGILTLSAANTFTGGTTVNGGTLRYGVTDALAPTGPVTLANAAGATLDLNETNSTIGALSGGGTAGGNVRNDGSGASTLTIGATGSAANTVYAGTITNGASSTAVSLAGGTLELINNGNTYSGGTTVNGGTLIAGNSTALGTGLLAVHNGTLTVGNNNVIQVGSYAQTNGILELKVSGTGQAATADQLRVTNTLPSQTALGGNLTANLAGFIAGPRAPGTPTIYTFTLVNTNNGLTGAFSSFDAIDLGVGLTAGLQYTTDDVILQIIAAASGFSSVGLTPNQAAVLGSINGQVWAGNVSTGFVTLANALTGASNNPATLGAQLDQLSPQEFAQFTSDTAFNNASYETEEMDSYLASRRAGDGTFLAGNGSIDANSLTVNDPSYDPNLATVHSRLLAWNPAPATGVVSDVAAPVLGGVDMKAEADPNSLMPQRGPHPWNVYVRGNVILAQGFSQAGTAHFDDDTGSVVLGADYRVTPNFLVGLTAGYAHTDATLDNNGSSATVDSYSPGLYASFAEDGWYVNLMGSYLHNAYTQSRNIGFLGQTATSSPEGNEGVVDLDDGYDFHCGGLTFGPMGGIQYTHLSVDGYNESGSVADLSVNDSESDSLRARIGGRISYTLAHAGITFTPHLDATYQHEFLDQSRGITSQFNAFGGGSFDIRTINPSRESALVDAGFDIDLNRTFTVFTDYLVQAGQDNYFGQSVQAGMKIGF
jgi:outer membrane autotransporter protein